MATQATVRNVGNFSECVLDYVENNDIRDVELDIAALQVSAGIAGDLDQVELCRQALRGDYQARRRCAEVIVEHADVGC
jgi:hypothetical protein